MKPIRTYLALGDSMSIDRYTGVAGGGAVAQLYRRLQGRQDADWRLVDETYDGCTMAGVPLSRRPGGVDLITVTIGGNDLLQNMHRPLGEYLPEFQWSYRRLLGRLQKLARPASAIADALVVVGNIYHPQWPLRPELHEALDQVNRFIADKVRRYGFCLADIAAAFRGREAEYLCRDIEPTLKGAAVIANLFGLQAGVFSECQPGGSLAPRFTL
jgi:lysophospholipase L1-like esterase